LPPGDGWRISARRGGPARRHPTRTTSSIAIVKHRQKHPESDTPQRSPRVTDLGCAKQLGFAGARQLDRNRQVVGTPLYVSPQRIRIRVTIPPPPRDVYGTRATLYHALTGQPPSRHHSIRVYARPSRPRNPNPVLLPRHVPIALAAVVARLPGQGSAPTPIARWNLWALTCAERAIV